MRNVQTQAQTRASVGPYADYKDGLIVLTGRERGQDGGGWLQLQPQLSTVIAHHRQVKQVTSEAPVLLGNRWRPLVEELKCHLHRL